jgi:hypothetical protein
LPPVGPTDRLATENRRKRQPATPLHLPKASWPFLVHLAKRAMSNPYFGSHSTGIDKRYG